MGINAEIKMFLKNYPSLIITEPDALDIVMLFPVVFTTGFGVADGSIVTAFKVPFTLRVFIGLVVPMPTKPACVI